MEIEIKEITNFEEYEIAFKNHLNDPDQHVKPKYDYIRTIMGFNKHDILSYRILQVGVIDEDKVEIIIKTNTGEVLNTNYDKKVHDALKKVITELEETIDRDNNLNKEEE